MIKNKNVDQVIDALKAIADGYPYRVIPRSTMPTPLVVDSLIIQVDNPKFKEDKINHHRNLLITVDIENGT